MIPITEQIRTVYNRALYFIGGLLLGWLPGFQLFPDANGWTLTFKYGGYLYKCMNIPMLFRKGGFRQFKEFHTQLASREGYEHIVPLFAVHRACVRYTYLEGATNLLDALLASKTIDDQVHILRTALVALEAFHTLGFVHGDAKPKNLLIQDGKAYLIDLEHMRPSYAVDERMQDFRKLLERVIYLFTYEECLLLEQEGVGGGACRHVLQSYLRPFNARSCVEGIPQLTFQDETDAPGKDIDCTVPSITTLGQIYNLLSTAGIDYHVFYYARNDIKLYAYTLAGGEVLDVHITNPLSRRAFRMARSRSYGPVEFAIAGPDGVGKTTVLNRMKEQFTQDAILRIFPACIYHASRVPEQEKFNIARFRRAYSLLTRTAACPVILWDRTFYDTAIRSGSWRARIGSIPFAFGRPRSIRTILLVDNPLRIYERKQEISQAEIARYYLRIRSMLPLYAEVAITDETATRCIRIIRHALLTDVRLMRTHAPSRRNA